MLSTAFFCSLLATMTSVGVLSQPSPFTWPQLLGDATLSLIANITAMQTQINTLQSKLSALSDKCTCATQTTTPTTTTKSTTTTTTPTLNINCALIVNPPTTPDGWIIIQRNTVANLNFNWHLNWAAYKAGFGNCRSDTNDSMWLGNEALHRLTATGHYRLRVDLQDWNNSRWYFAEYTTFYVGSEATNYTNNITGYVSNSTVRDSINSRAGQQQYTGNQPFTTFDRDNSPSPFLCASWCGLNTGGWWFPAGCTNVVINGFCAFDPNPDRMYWEYLPSSYAKYARMMIRRA